MYSAAGILGEAFWSTDNTVGAQHVSVFYFELDSCYLQLISHSFFIVWKQGTTDLFTFSAQLMIL